MPYQGSTQSVGFRNRQVSDTKSQEAQSLAQALDKQRVSQVNEMRQVSRDQLSEMSRQDKQLVSNDKYELKNLAKFSKTLNKALEESAKTVGKAYIDTKRQEGIDRARACYNGDEEACAGVKLDQDQVNAIEAKVEEMRTNSLNVADKFELEAKIKKYKLSLEEKATALNIRKLGSNVAYGYRQGLLIERAKGYKDYLQSALLPSFAEDGVTRLDEEVTVKNALNEDITVRIGDFDKQSGDIQSQIIRHIEKKFIEESDGGFNRNVVNTYLTTEVVKESDRFRNETLEKAQVKQAEEELQVVKTQIDDSFKTIDANPEKAKAAIQNALLKLTSIERRLGGEGSPNSRAKARLIKLLVASGSRLSEKGNEENVDDMEDVLNLLENEKFTIPGHGEVNLTEFWKGDLNIEDLRGSMLKTWSTRVNAENNALNLSARTGIETAKDEFRKDGNREKYETAIKLLGETEVGGGTEWTKLMGDALAWKLDLIPEEQANKDAAQLYKDYSGEIPLEKTKKWPTSVLEKYKDYIVAPGDGIADTELAKNQLNSAHTAIDTAVNGLFKGSAVTKNDVNPLQSLHAAKMIKAQIPGMVREMRLTDKTSTNAQLIEKAKIQIISGIEADKAGTGDGTYLFDTSNGGRFVNKSFQMPVPEVPGSRANELKYTLNNAVSQINGYDGDIFQDKEIKLINDPTSPLLKGRVSASGEPGTHNGVEEIWKKLANEDPLERTSFELLNLERAKHGLEPIKWDQTTQNFINNYNSQNSEIKALLRSGITLLQERGIDLSQGISSRNMHSALISGDGASMVSEGELPSLLAGAGLGNMTYEEFLANPEAVEKVSRYKVNQLIPMALSLTKNKLTAIRMVGAARNVPLDQAVEAMNNWGTGEMDASTAATLNAYLSGNTDNLKYTNANTSFTKPTLVQPDGEINYSQLDGKPIPNSLVGLDTQIAELEKNPPPQYKEGPSFLHVQQRTDASVLHEAKLAELKTQRFVMNVIFKGTSDRKYTSSLFRSRIKRVIGEERYNELVKSAGGFPKAWKDHRPFNAKFETLLKALPEFSGGIE